MPPPSDPLVPGDGRRKALGVWVALGVLIAGAYVNSFRVPFLMDDEMSILQNESLALVPDFGAVLWPRSDVFTAGRPLLNLSLALNHAWGGTVPWGYHLVNVTIHLLAAVTLFGLVRTTLALPRFGQRFQRSADLIAASVALVWALHPLQTVSVTYVSQRAESLMGLFYLLTLFAFLRAASRPGGWSLVCIAACWAGTLVKEVMVTAPIVAFLLDGIFVAGSFGEAWRKRRRLHLGLAASWIILATILVASRIGERGIGYAFSYSWHQYLRIEIGAVFHYLQLSLFPHPLVFDYGEAAPLPSAATTAWQAALLTAFLAATTLGLARRKPSAFVCAWFVLILAPTSSVVPVAGQPIAENRLYLPLAGVSVGCVLVAVELLGRRAFRPLLCGAVMLGLLTVARNRTFESDLSIWADTLRQRPASARAHMNFGYALQKRGRLEEATKHLKEAIRLSPDYFAAHNNLGGLFLGQGRLDEGAKHLEIAIRIKPNDPMAHNNLGTAFQFLGKLEDAVPRYQAAIRLRPDYTDAKINLGLAYGRLGRLEEALATFEDVTRANPGHAHAREMLETTRKLLSARPPKP